MWEEFSRDYNCKIRIDWRDGRPLALAKREKTRTQLQREKTWFSSHEKTANSKAVECRQRKPRKGIDPPTYSRSFFKKYTVIFARIKKKLPAWKIPLGILFGNYVKSPGVWPSFDVWAGPTKLPFPLWRSTTCEEFLYRSLRRVDLEPNWLFVRGHELRPPAWGLPRLSSLPRFAVREIV